MKRKEKEGDFMDYLQADAEYGAAMFMLNDINNLPECKEAENGFTDRHSAQVFVCAQSIIKSKKKMGLSISKKDNQLLKQSLTRLQKYIITLDHDEQIKVLKYVQPS